MGQNKKRLLVEQISKISEAVSNLSVIDYKRISMIKTYVS